MAAPVRSSWVEHDECASCLELLDEDIVTLKCEHIFHKTCIAGWIRIKQMEKSKNPASSTGPTCPTCRAVIKDTEAGAIVAAAVVKDAAAGAIVAAAVVKDAAAAIVEEEGEEAPALPRNVLVAFEIEAAQADEPPVHVNQPRAIVPVHVNQPVEVSLLDRISAIFKAFIDCISDFFKSSPRSIRQEYVDIRRLAF
jgi:hypothetical protein